MIRNILEENDNVQPNDRTMEVLHREFPQCFNAEGKFDIAALQELLQDKVDLVKEGSGFNFLGKNYASLLGSMDTTTVLVPDTEHNEKPENKDSQNVYISGDNLDALKHLVKSYSGKVKCIYIDPPYNTGSDGFVYNDKFKFTAEELEEKLSISEEQAQRIFAMTTRGAASHAAWLTFMMPRLQYAKDLLSDDGVIFISIDDNEQANLKLLCDYVFGEENFIAQFIWEKRLNRENRAETSIRHDYILCYSKFLLDDDSRRIMQLPMTGKALASYTNPDNDPRGPWKSDPAHAQAGHGVESQFYTVVAPNGKRHELPSGRCWIYNEEDMKKAIEDNRIWFGMDGNGVPRVKTYLNSKERGLTPETMLFAKDCGTNEKAKNDLKELFDGVAVFETPKPVELVTNLLQMAIKEGIVVDFFGGSSSTAHAIMDMAVTNSNIKYFLIQLQEPCKPDSEAAKAGYKTIDQIGMERIKRAAKKIKEQNPLFAGDLGFKHYTLQEPDENTIDQMLKFEPTQMFGDNLLDKFGKDTVLSTYAMRDGYGLTPEFKEVKFGGYTAYLCGKHLYMLDSEFNVEEDLTDLVDTYNKDHSFPADNVVIFGYSFNFSQTDAIKKNLGAITDRNRINVDIRY